MQISYIQNQPKPPKCMIVVHIRLVLGYVLILGLSNREILNHCSQFPIFVESKRSMFIEQQETQRL